MNEVQSSGDEINVAKFKAVMLKERSDLIEWINNHKQQLSEGVPHNSDNNDNASDYEIYMRDKKEAERRVERLMRLEQRLKDMNDFGYCIDCGIEISPKRLKIDPTFERCIDCSERKAAIDRNFAR